MRSTLRLAVGITVAALSTVSASSAFAQMAAGPDSSHSPLPISFETGIGESSIDRFRGEFNEHIAIAVPPYHGIEPKLALQHHSSSPNGFVGVGWSLVGVSVIQRASPGRGAPAYNSSDIFLLDGQELVPCTMSSQSPSCLSGGNYSTKIESYVRIKFDGTWTITRKDGTSSTYSATNTAPGGQAFRWGLSSVTDTRGNAVSYGWSCDYLPSSGFEGGPGLIITPASGVADCYPDTITYNGTKITLYREQRPDAITFAYGAALGETNYRLKTVDVTVSGSRARTYQLTYSSSPSTGRSVLQRVQQYGKDATVDAATGTVTGGTALPATSMTYQAGNQNFTIPQPWTFSNNLLVEGGPNYVLTGDFNGDGKTDIAYPRSDGWEMQISNGSGFTRQTWSGPSCSPNWAIQCYYLTGDFNGDGKTDIAFTMVYFDTVNDHHAGSTRWTVLLSNPSGSDFLPAQHWDIPLVGGCYDPDYGHGDYVPTGLCGDGFDIVVAGDFNGDGKTDIAFTRRGWGGWAMSISTGSGFVTTTSSGGPLLWSTGVSGGNWLADLIVPARILTGDFNGDGKTDIAFTVPGSSNWTVHLSNPTGDNFNVETWSDFSPNGLLGDGQDVVVTGDFNGDGKTDIAYTRAYWPTWRVLTSTGSNFIPQNWTISGGLYPDRNNRVVVGDFNGDGKTDIAFTRSGWAGWAMHISNGSDFSVPQNGWSMPLMGGCLGANGLCDDGDNYIVTGDFDGDGKTDIAYTRPKWGGFAMSMGQGSYPDLLSSVSNGFGATTTVTYQPSTSWPAAHMDASCFDGVPTDCPDNPPIEQLVSTVTVNDGQQGTKVSTTPASSNGHISTTSFSYAGGYYDRQDRRHLGFHYVKKTLPCNSGEVSCPYEETWFRQDYGSVTKPQQINRSSGDGGLLTSVIYEYATNGATIPYQSLEVGRWDYIYDRKAGTYKRKYVRYWYDSWDCHSGSSCVWMTGYGNRTQSFEYGDFDTQGDERTTNITYAYPNAAAYIVGLPAAVDVYSGIGTTGPLLRESLVYYDGTTTWQAPPSVGNATMTARWSNPPTTGATSLVGPQGPASYVVKKFGYDQYGNLTSETDENGNPTSYTYDPYYHELLWGVSNALNQTWTANSLDAACFAVTQVTDPNLQQTSTTLDPLCRPTQITTPLGGFTTFKYCETASSSTNSCGAPSQQMIEVDTPSADGNGNQWVQARFDGLGRIWRVVRKGPTSTQGIALDTTFNSRGRTAQETAPYYSTDTLQWTTYVYDALDRMVTLTHPDNSTITRAYGLWTTTVTDELGHPKTDTVDAYGNVVQHQDKLGSTYINMTYGYDLLGNLTSITDASGNLWSYVPDTLGRTTQTTDPDLGTWQQQYDPAGNLVWQRDANGRASTFAYDALNRITSITTADTAPSPTVSWTYDEARSGFYNVGALTTASDVSGSQTSNYDAAGRLVGMTRSIGNSEYAFAYGYDAGGRLLWRTYPDGDAVGAPSAPLGYDGAGRLMRIPNIVDSATYDAWDHLVSLTNHNGTTTMRTFSPTRGWLTGITTSSSGGAPIQNISYTRDAKGRVTLKTSPFCLEGWSYSYDDFDRLVAALNHSDYNQNVAFSYDVVGNITSNSRIGAYTYPTPGPTAVRPHAVLTAGPNSYSYDGNGNMVSGSGRTITYDALNRPVSVNGVIFTYGSDGSRLAKLGSTATYYLGDDYEISNGQATKYIRLAGDRVAKRVGATPYWLHTDDLSSTNVLTDINGTEVLRKKYQPYGDTLQSTTSLTESTGFIGERQDETGLIYLHARYYDPALARFISADPSHPMLRGVGVNRYAYALGNPIERTDSTGLDVCEFGCTGSSGTGDGFSGGSDYPYMDGTGGLPTFNVSTDQGASSMGGVGDGADSYGYPEGYVMGGGMSQENWGPNVPGGVAPGLADAGGLDFTDPYLGMSGYFGSASGAAGQQRSWPFPVAYERASQVLGAAGIDAALGEPLCKVSWFKGTWGAERTGLGLRGGAATVFGFQSVLDYYAVQNYMRYGPGDNAISPEKGLTNFGVGAVGMAGGTPGLVLSTYVSLIDMGYPKGSHEGGLEAWWEAYKASTERLRRWREENVCWPQCNSRSYWQRSR